jgi:hypothetical protein
MTSIIDTESKGGLSAKLAAGLVISAVLALGIFTVPADAQWNSYTQWNDKEHPDQNHWNRDNWNRGYYRPPPVVYGSPYGSSYYGRPYYAPQYYYPPPVVYGPGIGILLPGISINIR